MTVGKKTCELGAVAYGDVVLNCEDVAEEAQQCMNLKEKRLDWGLFGECYDLLRKNGVNIEVSDLSKDAGFAAGCTVTMSLNQVFIECQGSDPLVCFIHAACETVRACREKDIPLDLFLN